MKYSIPHEPVEPIKRNIPSRRFDARASAFSRIEGLERKSRLLCVLSYLGLVPFLYFSGASRQQNPILKYHIEHSLGFAFLTLLAIILYEATYIPAQFVNVYIWKPTLAEYYANGYWMEPIGMAGNIAAILFVAYSGAAWLTCLVAAWRGKTPRVFFLSRMFSYPFIPGIGAYWFLLIEAMAAAVIFMGFRSIEISSRPPSKDAKVYVLYTIGGYIPVDGLFQTYTPPRWAATFAFYPLIAAGIDKYGEDGIAVLPMTEENFDQAIGSGKFIFIASHGGWEPGSFALSILPDIEYLPSDIQPSRVGDDLQFVYFAGCYTGKLEAEWRDVLRLDDAILFDRLSSVDEHMLWVWFKSPGVIGKLQ